MQSIEKQSESSSPIRRMRSTGCDKQIFDTPAKKASDLQFFNTETKLLDQFESVAQQGRQERRSSSLGNSYKRSLSS